MENKKTHIILFISFTSDVEQEMDLLREIIEDFNKSYLKNKKFWIECKDWKRDVPHVLTGERTQGSINTAIGEYDIYFGILWKYFGEKGKSGFTPTEEEFQTALTSLKSRGKPLIIFFFKNKDIQTSDYKELEQYNNVNDFKKYASSLDIGIYENFIEKDDFVRKVIKILYDLFEDTSTLFPKLHLFRKNKYNFPKEYILRKVCYIKDYEKNEFKYIFSSITEDIINVLNKEKLVTLICDAGIGKSVELDRIAAFYSSSKDEINPFLISLNNYVDQKIEDLFSESFQKTPNRQALIILDGLDEIPSMNKANACRNIEKFIKDYPDIRCLVSSRTNFYSAETNVFSGTLKDFKTYVLLELQGDQIQRYIQGKLTSQSEDFNNMISNNNLEELLSIPFYLIHFVSLFKEQRYLPKNKAEIFNDLIDKRIIYDREKYRTTDENVYESKSDILRAFEKIALSMELLGKNFIVKEELDRIINDKEVKAMLYYSSLFRKIGSRFEFEHNNFREYLTAKILSNKNIVTLKEFFSFKPNYKKIIPSRINTLSFLFSILKPGSEVFLELIDWILINDSEIIINIEIDRIEQDKRVEIFKQIFNGYKTKKVYVNRDKFNYRKLAKFAQSPETIVFLLDEIEKNETYPTLNNAIEMLGELEVSHVHIERARKLLLECILNRPSGVKYSAMRTIADLKLNNKDTIETILKSFRYTEEDIIRAGIYFIIQNSEYNDDYIDIYLEGIKYIKYDNIPENYTIHRETRIGDESIYLMYGIEKLKSSTAFKRLFKFFIENPTDIRDIHLHFEGEFIDNLVKAYILDNTIYENVIEFILFLNEKYLLDPLKKFVDFFIKTETQFKAFKEILKISEDSFLLWRILALLTNNDALDYLISEYQAGNIADGEIWSFKNNLSSVNEPLFNIFDKLLNKFFGDKFVNIQPVRDRDKEREDALNDYIEFVFKKDDFLKRIDDILSPFSDAIITEKEIHKLQMDNFETNKIIDFMFQEIRKIVKYGKHSVQQIKSFFDKKDWDIFVISQVYSYLSNNWKVNLNSEKINWIFNWCQDILKNVDFKKELVFRGKEFSTSWNAVYVWFFLRKLNFEFEKSILLDLLSFDWFDSHNWVGIQYLETKLTKNEITKRIFENLKANELRDRIIYNYIDYCKRNNIVEIIEYIAPVLTNINYSEETRKLSLDTYMILSISLSDLANSIKDIKDDFRWKVIDEIVSSRRIDISEILKEIFVEGDENTKLKSSYFLIQYQDMEALNFYVEILRAHKRIPHIGWSLPNYSLPHLFTIDALPFLIELLKIIYNPNFKDDEFYSMKSVVLSCISNIAVLDQGKYYDRVREEVLKFIAENSNLNNEINFINVTLEQIEQNIYKIKAESLDIKKVIEKVNFLTE